MLLSFFLQKDRVEIGAHPTEKIPAAVAKNFLDACAQRASGLPLAYITHHREFYSLDFYVDEHVLIPRPETEHLVEEVLARSAQMASVSGAKKELRILDLGTGSGCIAVAVAKNLPQAKITASDISKQALAVARKNVDFHKVADNVELVSGDLLKPFINDHFDIIVTNLPYIAEDDPDVAQEVREFEPRGALFSGPTGFELFTRLFAQVQSMKKKPQFLIGEMGAGQKKGLKRRFPEALSKFKVKWKKDLAGLDRLFVLQFS